MMKIFKVIIVVAVMMGAMFLFQGIGAVQSKTSSPLPEEKDEVMLAYVSCEFDTESGCPGKNQICCDGWCVPKDKCDEFRNSRRGSQHTSQVNPQDVKIQQLNNLDCRQLKEIIANNPDILNAISKITETPKSESSQSAVKEEQNTPPYENVTYPCYPCGGSFRRF